MCDWICLWERSKALSVSALLFVMSPSQWINTPAKICLSPLILLFPLFGFPLACMVRCMCKGRGDDDLDTCGCFFGVELITVCLCLCRIKVRPLPIPWLPKEATPVLKVSRPVHLMWYRSVPEQWPVTVVTAAQPTSAPTCKVCYSFTYFITQEYIQICLA